MSVTNASDLCYVCDGEFYDEVFQVNRNHHYQGYRSYEGYEPKDVSHGVPADDHDVTVNNGVQEEENSLALGTAVSLETIEALQRQTRVCKDPKCTCEVPPKTSQDVKKSISLRKKLRKKERKLRREQSLLDDRCDEGPMTACYENEEPKSLTVTVEEEKDPWQQNPSSRKSILDGVEATCGCADYNP